MHSLDQIDPSWLPIVEPEMAKPYMQQIRKRLHDMHEQIPARERKYRAPYYPAPGRILASLEAPLDEVKVVILGQDPYHGPGQAMGLAFSVRTGVAMPPSLRNIWRELQGECGESVGPPVDSSGQANGDLSGWARQGVLLLNTSLTVEPGRAGSHANWGWGRFTDCLIQAVNEQEGPVVFLLWGAHALSKRGLINEQRHHVLVAPHPSPLSAYRGFFGCGHFLKANELLASAGRPGIDWQSAAQADQ